MANNQYTFSSAEERLLSRVEMIPECGCWIWMGSVNRDGYGQVSLGGKMRKAHDVSYEMFIGPVPAGLELDHLCRVRCCCNPRHVEPVTHAENMRRGICREVIFSRTHCRAGHPYTGRNLIVTAKGLRRCRECARLKCHNRRVRLGLPVGMGKGGNTKAVRWSR